MALPRFQYTGTWENPADFPTHEYSEAQVRRDNMRYFTEIQSFLNRTLIPLLEAGASGGGDGEGASGGGDGEGASGGFLPKAGGQMTGPLLLWDNPSQLTEAATKQYVDSTSSLIAEGLDDSIAALTVELGRIQAIVDDGLGNVTEITAAPGKIEAILQDDLGRLLETLLSSEQMKLHFQDGLQNSGMDLSAEDFRLWFENMAGRMAEIIMGDSEIAARVRDEAEGLETNVSITADGLASTVEDLFHDIQSIIQQRPDLISAAVTDAADDTSASLSVTPEEIAAAVENAVSRAGLDISASEIAAEVRDKLTGGFSQATMTESQMRAIVENALSQSQIVQDAEAIRQIVSNLETGQSASASLTAEQIDFIARGVNGEFASVTMAADEIRQMVGDGLTKQAVLDIMEREINLRVQNAVKNATFSITPDGVTTMVTNSLTGNSAVQQILEEMILSRVRSALGGSTELVQTDTELRQLVVGPDSADDLSSLSLTSTGIYGTVQNHTGQIAAINATAQEISARIAGAEGSVAALSVRADGIDTTVAAQGENLSEIQQAASSISSRVQDAEADLETMSGRFTSIEQTLDNISLTAAREGSYVRFQLSIPGHSPQVGEARIDGNVDVSGELSAEALYAAKGEVAQLSVDQLTTSRRVTKYLNRDNSDDNFIRVYNQFVEFVTGECTGQTEQARTPDGHLLYWDAASIDGYTVGSDGYPVVNGSRVYTTTTPGSPAVPVTVYRYNDVVKLALKFDTVGNTYTPVAVFGAGNAQGYNKGYIVKSTEGFDFKYISNNNGREVGIRMTNDGYVDIDGLRRTTGLNFSGWDNGSFSETVEGRAVPAGYGVSFDSQHRPVSIADSAGHALAIQW